MHPYEIEQALDGERGRRARLVAELDGLQARVRTSTASDGTHERILNVRSGLEKADRRVEELESELAATEARHAALARVAENPRNRESGDGAASGGDARTTDRGVSPQVGAARDQGLRAVESMRDVLDAGAGDRLVELIQRDRHGLDSRYIAAVSDRHYERAFAKRLARPDTAHQEFTPEEAGAVRQVAEATAERAMSLGDPAGGGYGVPFALDPTLTNVSDSATNPVRALATVTPITVNEWRGVNTEGVTATFAPEGAEVGDDSPTLSQPTVKAEKLQMFVPFTIEVGMDYMAFTEELGRLFADARDQIEADKFINGAGAGSNEPQGLVAGLTGPSIIDTASSGTLAIADIYKAQEALGPRFQPRASWLASNTIANAVYRFVGGGSVEPPLFDEPRQRLLGKPYAEASTMDSTVAAGNKVIVYGDVAAAYRLVERVGLQVELVPHLLSTTHGRPYGTRGLYAWARVGGGVQAASAARVLRIKA